MNKITWELQALKQVAADVDISFTTWRQLRAKGYVESDIQNTPDGVYGILSERGRAVLASAPQAQPATEAAKAEAVVNAAKEWARMEDEVGFDESIRICDALTDAVLKYEAAAATGAATEAGSEAG